MGELEAELASLRDAAAAAEARASSMESTVTTAKEQLLRLNADFENFRRRTVSAAQGCSFSRQHHACSATGAGASSGSTTGLVLGVMGWARHEPSAGQNGW